MGELKQVGIIFKDEKEREIYLVLEDDQEVYFFGPGSFYQGLTRFADRGCKLKDIFKKMEEIAEQDPEFQDMDVQEINIPEDIDEKELGFV